MWSKKYINSLVSFQSLLVMDHISRHPIYSSISGSRTRIHWLHLLCDHVQCFLLDVKSNVAVTELPNSSTEYAGNEKSQRNNEMKLLCEYRIVSEHQNDCNLAAYKSATPTTNGVHRIR